MIRKKRENTRPGQRDRDENRVMKRRRVVEGMTEINLKDPEILRKFITDHGKIMPTRITGLNAKNQRKVRRAIHRARVMGLLV
jgi:small subunit ribosomal protein S18